MAQYEWKTVYCNATGEDKIAAQLQNKLNELDLDGFEVFTIYVNSNTDRPVVVARKKKG